jgi:acetylornithine deacetylase/succinyl-diaminopimelate desuccinylase-like protein
MARPLSIDRAFLLDTAVTLVNTESVAPGEQAIIDRLESLAKDLGMKTRRIPLEPGRDNLLATIGRGSPVICLDAHVDTVPASGRSVPKATIESGRLLGLGACDDKGPLAAMLAAVKALIESGWNGPGRIDLLMTLEEETVGRGIRAVTDSGYQCDYAICAEPTNLCIAVSHPGLVFLEVQAEGRAAHGSLPEKGVNALDLAYSFVQDLRAAMASWPKHPLAGCSSVNLGALHGGDRPNRVPDQATALIDVRVAPPMTVENAACLAANLAEKRGKINTRVVMTGEALNTNPAGALVGALRKAALAVTGKRARTVGWRAWSEAGVLQNATRSQVVVFGPGQLEQAHSSDEFIDIEQLCASAEICARAVALLLEGKK